MALPSGAAAAPDGPPAPEPPREAALQGRLETVARVGGAVMDAVVLDGTAYMGKGTRLLILDVQQPENPVQRGSTGDMPDIVQGVASDGKIACVADGGGGLWIYDVSAPETPRFLNRVDAWASGVALEPGAENKYIYFTDGDFHILDAHDLEAPQISGSLETPGYASAVAVLDGTAYLADGENGLLAVDIRDPKQPKLRGSLALPGYAYNLAVAREGENGRTLVFLANGEEGGLRIVDASDPQAMQETGFLAQGMNVRDLALAEGTVLAANGEHGLALIDVARPEAPVLKSAFDTPGFALAVTGEEAGAGEGDAPDALAYLSDGGGLVFLDFSDPEQPKQVGSFDVLGAAYDVALHVQPVQGEKRTYAYVADYYSGVYALDVSNAEQRPTVTGFYDAPGYTHAVALAESETQIAASGRAGDFGGAVRRVAYVSGPMNGMRAVDASSPYLLRELGAYEGSLAVQNPALAVSAGHAPGAQEAADAAAYVYLAEGTPGGLRILAVHDPQEPHEVGYFSIPGGARSAAVYHAAGKGGTAAAKTYVYVAAGPNGIQVLDVSDAANPTLVDVLDTPGTASGLAVLEATLYLADGEEGGLRIYTLQDPQAPQETGSLSVPGDAHALSVQDERVYLAGGSAGVFVADVSDPSRPLLTAQASAPGYVNSVAAYGDMLYAACRGAGLVVMKYLAPRLAEYAVNSREDGRDAVPGDGSCAALGGACTLRAAIMEANALPGVDTIHVPEGIYTLTLSGDPEDGGSSGDLDVTDHLILRGAGHDKTILDGGGIERVLHFLGDGSLWADVSGVTVQNGLGGINVNASGSFSLRESLVTQNAGYGVWGVQSAMRLEKVQVSENVEDQVVGGVGSHLGSLTIVDSTIYANRGADGGVFADGALEIVNTTISGNTGLSGAGGVRAAGKARLRSVTVAENRGITGGGLNGEGGLHIANSLVAANLASAKGPDCSGKLISEGHNLIADPTGFVLERGEGDQIGAEAGIGALSKRPGLALIHPLTPASKAIDAGAPDGCLDALGQVIAHDQTGNERMLDGDQDGNRQCDIGAAEYSAEQAQP